MAEHGDPRSFDLPRPLMRSGTLDFSFAGLKTAVAVQLQRLGNAPCEQARIDLAAATQAAIVDVLVSKCLLALSRTGEQRLVVSGGVGANRRLREHLDTACAARGARVHYPDLEFCTDNGAMIALAAAMRLGAGCAEATFDYAFDVKPRWDLAAL
jgi:N6-L-threonylcarbamoyladenine synthase